MTMATSEQNICIDRTTHADLATIIDFFNASVGYQEKNGFPSWRNFDLSAITDDIGEGCQYKINLNNTIAIVFSIIYEDPVIWRQYEKNDAVYLHRIVVNPAFKGQKMLGHIIKWSAEHARLQGRQLIRMDTWAGNSRLIDYYLGFGFRHIENYTTPDSEAIPAHNRNLHLALLEMNIS